ncbi:aldo/keto reductase [Paenirhodobacter sp. CAU 1674]|uniref:aldo/keto reductase n=1 Tax=Paenirhodobacter sp. CAU 1674 TaxID=3032596 RepID=UPI0023D9D72E|nr:aldo/keto reductase [Paenirhodobacter sp. CAU 1674]MDF2141198.1 aldo/keto reductase [Paenirhodobacter sp. CAU 1674]
MNILTVPGSDICVSKLIFGTASLFNVRGTSARQRLVEAAVDAGFTHFDTAPYYGFGVAERDLASTLKMHPDVTVTTKVGIYSPGGEKQPKSIVFARKAGGRIFKSLSRPTIDFSIARARKALEGSLGRLGRDHIDIYMLHEPEIDLLSTEEWQRWLEDEKATGRIRAFGFASTADRMEPFVASGTLIGGVHQVCDSLERREADILTRNGLPLQITYSYVSAARAAGSHRAVPEILKDAMNRNRAGAIIVSSTKESRMYEYSQMVQDWDAEQGVHSDHGS